MVHENIRFILTTGFILLGLPELIDGWRPFRIHNYNLSAYSLSDKVSINASIINLEGVSLYINVKKNIERPFIRFEIYVDSGKGITDLKYLNETVDMCRFFKNKTYLPFIQILYRILVDQGNYPSSCPIKKNLYKGENMKLDVEKLPPTLPAKMISIAAIASTKEGSTMKPLLVYRVTAKIVNV